MAKSWLLRRLILLILIPAAVLAAALLIRAAEAGGDISCRGSIAECMGRSEEEFGMDSESNRRILATTDHISYSALDADTAACSQRGASYYNCQPGAEANPYQRECTAITQCRS